jgi:hypothetical protein
MATQQQQQRHWYNDRELFFHGFVRSNYITSFTDWFMGLAGKATELVLYATVLYSCAQLYPHVNLPAGLSLAVFLVQMGALDIGGLSLGKLAKQAREDGNPAGADQAATLSKWLIGIMLVGVVTVGLEHALPVALPSWVTVSIDVALVIGRSIAAVLYGRVVHDLKQDIARMMPVADVQARFTDFTEHLTEIEQRISNQVTEKFQLLEHSLTEHIERLSGEQNTVVDLTPMNEILQEHTRALTDLATLPALLEKQLKQALQEMKEITVNRPRLSLVGAFPPVTEDSVKASESEIDKGAFVRACLTEHPEWRNADIQRTASEKGITISPAHISQIRKAFEERSA